MDLITEKIVNVSHVINLVYNVPVQLNLIVLNVIKKTIEKCFLFFFNEGECKCVKGYFDNNKAECSKCGYSCKTCKNQFGCSSCNKRHNRILIINKCQCISGFFDNGVSYCKKCHKNCQACIGSRDIDCLSCNTKLY